MAHPTPHAAGDDFNVLDPHGFEQGHGQHASHVIVGPFTLRSVLVVLLVLTVATVGQAQLEVYLSHLWDIEFPKWVNVAFCMAIATVKALLVMGFFMQLRYDNPINSVIMAFTIFALGLFLGFTSLDLGGRDRVYHEKAPQVSAGGMGKSGTPQVTVARTKWLEAWGPETFAKYEADYKHAKGGHGHDADAHARSSAQRTRPATGLTNALSVEPATGGTHPGDPHAQPAHAQPAHAEPPAGHDAKGH